MIAYFIYLLLLLSLIYFTGFLKLFTDKVITKKQFAVLFFLKTLAIPVFYFVYQKIYGGIEKFDSGKFYNDAGVISEVAKTDIFTYLKLLFGLQNDQPGSYDFLMVQQTVNWDNGEIKDFLYNDNRVLIRVHSLVHFVSFNSIFVHALFNCFISFVGIYFLYKTFAEYFIGKELWVLSILCFFPALWFYTGALLKEGISLFVLGCALFQIKQLFLHKLRNYNWIWLISLLYLSLLLKPYLLFLAMLCFSLFFFLNKFEILKHKFLYFLLIMISFVVVLNGISLLVKHRSLYTAALTHQRIFSGVAQGGIFLYDTRKFIRLPYDSTLIEKVSDKTNIYTIRKHAAFMYWEKSISQDTLYCSSNQDTITRYQLAYQFPTNNSNFLPISASTGFVTTIGRSLYYSLFSPLFFNAKGPLQYLASAENLVICFSFLIILIGCIRHKKALFLPLTFLFFAFSICLLIGIATPNSGAIFRYRSPALIFVLLAALYFIDTSKLTIFKRLH